MRSNPQAVPSNLGNRARKQVHSKGFVLNNTREYTYPR